MKLMETIQRILGRLPTPDDGETPEAKQRAAIRRRLDEQAARLRVLDEQTAVTARRRGP